MFLFRLFQQRVIGKNLAATEQAYGLACFFDTAGRRRIPIAS